MSTAATEGRVAAKQRGSAITHSAWQIVDEIRAHKARRDPASGFWRRRTSVLLVLLQQHHAAVGEIVASRERVDERAHRCHQRGGRACAMVSTAFGCFLAVSASTFRISRSDAVRRSVRGNGRVCDTLSRGNGRVCVKDTLSRAMAVYGRGAKRFGLSCGAACKDECSASSCARSGEHKTTWNQRSEGTAQPLLRNTSG